MTDSERLTALQAQAERTAPPRDERHHRWISAAGLDCVINPCDFSSGYYHLCGYVRVPESHQLFRMSYAADAPKTLDATIERVMNSPVGKRGVINIFCMAGRERPRVGDLFDVHGSITYDGDLAPGEPVADGWWYGFDCGHAGDDPAIQNDAYVRAECESLAEQIAGMA